MGQSPTLWINEQSQQMKAEGREVFKLGLGQSPFPVPDRVVQALQTHAHQKDYLPVEGLAELREAVAQYNHRTQKIVSTGADIMIGPGSKELMFLLQLVYYGDLVIPTPSWVSYAPQARMLGQNVHWVETHHQDNWHLLPERLEELCAQDPARPRLVIVNYPANPTGCTYSAAELKALAAVARKYQLIVLSDEIYGELHFEGKHVSLARYYPEGTIISSGLSKWCGAGGWRLGTFSFPKELRWLLEGMAAAASETYTSTSAPIQYASIAAFQEDPEIALYLKHSRQILKSVVSAAQAILHTRNVVTPNTEGAFYLFPDFSAYREGLAKRGISTSAQLCQSLLQDTGVATLPGSVFGRPDHELTLRMALVEFDGREALQYAQSTTAKVLASQCFETCCPRLSKALEALVQWLDNL